MENTTDDSPSSFHLENLDSSRSPDDDIAALNHDVSLFASDTDDGSQWIAHLNSAKSADPDQFISSHSLNASFAANDVNYNGCDTITPSSGSLPSSSQIYDAFPREVAPGYSLVANFPSGDIYIRVGSSIDLVYIPTATRKIQFLPSLPIPPLVMYLRESADAGTYKVLVVGMSPGAEKRKPSLSTYEYDSTIPVWEHRGNLDRFSLSYQYQSGAFCKEKSRGHEFLFFLANRDGTIGVLMYDFQKKNCAVNSFKPLALEISVASRKLDTAHVVGFHGSVFVLSEQEWQEQKYVFSHKLKLKASGGDGMVVEKVERAAKPYELVDGKAISRILVQREDRRGFTTIFGHESEVEGYVLMFSTGDVPAESKKKVTVKCTICLDIYPNGSGNLDKKQKFRIMELKITRDRAPDWSEEEHGLFVHYWQECRLDVNEVSRRLKEAGFDRNAKQCERHRDTEVRRKRKRELNNEANDGAESSNPPVPTSHLIQSGIADMTECIKGGEETSKSIISRKEEGMTMRQEEAREMQEQVQQQEQVEEIARSISECQHKKEELHKEDEELHEEDKEFHKKEEELYKKQGEWHFANAEELAETNPKQLHLKQIEIQWHLKQTKRNRIEEERSKQHVKELKKQKKLRMAATIPS